MKQQKKELALFFYSQAFEDGLRTTLAVLLPASILSYFDLFDLGLTISLGAACVSITDTPGPIVHRKNTMLFCLVFLFLVSLITSLLRQNMYGMGLEVALFSFFFSMFSIYGVRAANIANAALLAMVLTMDKPIPDDQVLAHSLFIVSGGLWYMLISMATYRARPYRTAQRALGENIRQLAGFLSIKADFYKTDNNLDELYKKLIAHQTTVVEKQDAAREVLYKTRQIVEESTTEGRRLVMAFIDAVDLFEEMIATYYNYQLLRQQYKGSGILESIHQLAKEISMSLDQMGIAIYTNRDYNITTNYEERLVEIKKKIDEHTAQHSGSTNMILKKILVNVRRMIQRNTDLLRYFSSEVKVRKESKAARHTLFVEHQSLDPKIFWNNLNTSSSVFRHAVRVCIACMVGFIVAKSIAKGYHSYWILMTIVFMLKPSFSLTKQRNIERVVGTLIGGVVGFLLLSLHPPDKVLFSIMVLLMIATYSLMRVRYAVSVVCMTPFILILFHFLGVGFVGLLQERILDTVVGCVITLLSGYLLFPDWESNQLKTYLAAMLKANTAYLEKITEGLSGKIIGTTEYKLVRKEVYVHSANLSAAFQRMVSEPSSTQKNKNEIHQFVVTNHILTSNIATIASLVLNKQNLVHSEKVLRTAHKSLSMLNESLGLFHEHVTFNCIPHEVVEESADPETHFLKEHMEFIYKLSSDIRKITERIIS